MSSWWFDFGWCNSCEYDITDINKKSTAYKNNLRKNDIITEVGRALISSTEDYENALKSYTSGDTIMLRIIKNGQPRYEAFEIE